eukprot:CAMPEP_0170502974 /NCGR_PEP_ID=MMETSP0208-20121228/43239_1 /TAXON_ID=197538 /ORGANISM="Strombidium inclinatum, Strain S3" /LENGTH=74 /DNA_ID=CAMNT_0010782375 /DNA_START=290 /DNA_END=514 /DNA_ORIENTATION=-
MHSEPTPIAVRDGKEDISNSFSGSGQIESSRHSLAKTIEEEPGNDEEDESDEVVSEGKDSCSKSGRGSNSDGSS